MAVAERSRRRDGRPREAPTPTSTRMTSSTRRAGTRTTRGGSPTPARSSFSTAYPTGCTKVSVCKGRAPETSVRTLESQLSPTLVPEEILKDEDALWFSPNGLMLAYASFNDTDVGKLYYTEYVESTSSQYPSLQSLPYPKVSQILPCVAGNMSNTTTRILHNRHSDNPMYKRP